MPGASLPEAVAEASAFSIGNLWSVSRACATGVVTMSAVMAAATAPAESLSASFRIFKGFSPLGCTKARIVARITGSWQVRPKRPLLPRDPSDSRCPIRESPVVAERVVSGVVTDARDEPHQLGFGGKILQHTKRRAVFQV